MTLGRARTNITVQPKYPEKSLADARTAVQAEIGIKIKFFYQFNLTSLTPKSRVNVNLFARRVSAKE
jgi:hypothetical protein